MLVYYDAIWNEKKGFDQRGILANVPSHLLPKVMSELYSGLIEDAPFLLELTPPGCCAFLQALKHDVLDQGDFLFHAGNILPIMYILVRGEITVQFPAPDVDSMRESSARESGGSGGDAGSRAEIMRRKLERKQSVKFGARSQIQRGGTLIGYQDVTKPPEPMNYSIRAIRRSAFFSITRSEMSSILSVHKADAPVWEKTIGHAQASIASANKTGRGSRKSVSQEGGKAESPRPERPPSAGSSTPAHVSSATAESLKSELQQIKELNEKLDSQEKMLEKVLTLMGAGPAGRIV